MTFLFNKKANDLQRDQLRPTFVLFVFSFLMPRTVFPQMFAKLNSSYMTIKRHKLFDG